MADTDRITVMPQAPVFIEVALPDPEENNIIINSQQIVKIKLSTTGCQVFLVDGTNIKLDEKEESNLRSRLKVVQGKPNPRSI